MSDPVIRYKKAIGKPGSFWVSVSSLKSQVEGGMLDPDDLIADVCDDREQLQAIFDEQPFSGHHGDGMSSCSNTSDTSDKDAAVEPAVVEPVGQQKSSLLNSDQKTQQLRRGSEPVLSGGSSGKTGSDPAAAKGEPGVILPAAGSVQAVVASINAINSNNSSSNNKREHFIKHRSKSSLNADNFWNGFSGNANPSGNGFHRASSQVNELRSSLRNVTSSSSVSAVPFLNGGSSDFQIIHTSPSKLASGGGPTTTASGSGNGTLTSTGTGSTGDSDDNMEGGLVHGGSGFSAQGFSTKLNVLRRREPLGANANKPGDEKPLEEQPPPPPKPAMELVPILKNSKSAGNLVMQGIEPGGRIDRDGRLAVGDEIIRINGYPLESTSFNKAQEVFKEALFAKELRLRVIKGKQLRPLGCSSTAAATAAAADDSLLNVSGESDTPSFNAATSVK